MNTYPHSFRKFKFTIQILYLWANYGIMNDTIAVTFCKENTWYTRVIINKSLHPISGICKYVFRFFWELIE